MNIRASIEDTRKGFEESFASEDFYNRQTQDAEHLERILAFINVRDGMSILDLGCGSGYLSFPIAEKNPGCEVIGLDTHLLGTVFFCLAVRSKYLKC